MLNLIKKSPHRNQLEWEIKRVLPTLKGSILDVGSQNRRYDYLMKTKPTAIDLVANMANDVIPGDVNSLPFGDSSFENIVCLEVLEYVSTPEKAVSEMYRVLAPGGNLVLSVPFMYKTHDDELRYTENYLCKLFSNFSYFEIRHIGNAYSIMLGVIFSLIKEKVFPIRQMLSVLYFPLTLFLPKRPVPTRYPSGYIIIAKK